MGNRIKTSRFDIPASEMYVTDCPTCGVIYGITADFEDRRREDHKSFYCPNGHSVVFSGPSKAEREAEEARKRAAEWRTRWWAEQDRAEAAMREAAEAKAAEVRLRWRVGNGVCPCCQRSFPGLAAHVATKHPDFAHRDLSTLSARMRDLLAAIKGRTDESDSAVIDLGDSDYSWRTIKALESRGLVEQIGYRRVALTEAGWPLAATLTADPNHH